LFGWTVLLTDVFVLKLHMHFRSCPLIYGNGVFKWIIKGDFPRFVALYWYLCHYLTPKKHVLTHSIWALSVDQLNFPLKFTLLWKYALMLIWTWNMILWILNISQCRLKFRGHALFVSVWLQWPSDNLILQFFFNCLHTFLKLCLFFSKHYTQTLHTNPRTAHKKCLTSLAKWSTAFKLSQTHLKGKHLCHNINSSHICVRYIEKCVVFCKKCFMKL